MKNLLTALMTKFSGSAFSTDVGGRIYYKGKVPSNPEFPYCVYSVVSAPKEKTFTEEYRDSLIQFSLFSVSAGVAEVTTMYNDLSTLFDECSLSITGSTLVWCREQNVLDVSGGDDDVITTPDGRTVEVTHWAVDYEIRTSLN
ncbi:MAG: hypothetical protein A4E60_02749 [Syntrophorhabdus sp. PtaB.Bin047]|nr:MAG: hypothetical protein A4E60_02749 [Syntrophorhabdus sp. PtaB.Bin047]